MENNFWSFTVILMDVKKQFNLSADEYIYMDMIARKAAEKGGWTDITPKEAAQILAFSESSIKACNSKLKAIGLLEEKFAGADERVPKRGSYLWWQATNETTQF